MELKVFASLYDRKIPWRGGLTLLRPATKWAPGSDQSAGCARMDRLAHQGGAVRALRRQELRTWAGGSDGSHCGSWMNHCLAGQSQTTCSTPFSLFPQLQNKNNDNIRVISLKCNDTRKALPGSWALICGSYYSRGFLNWGVVAMCNVMIQYLQILCCGHQSKSGQRPSPHIVANLHFTCDNF